ncbi:MAG TPA: type II toxin-antitoxin system RelE/ParE family toxin [Mucilaginibacter sp.]
MGYKLLIQKEALVELQEAFDWYEEQKIDLGYEFLNEVEVCYRNLSDYPERYSYINERYRRIKTDRFPYILVFEIEGNVVIVNTIRHIKRKPL